MKKHLIQTAVILAAVSAFGLTACAQGSTRPHTGHTQSRKCKRSCNYRTEQ